MKPFICFLACVSLVISFSARGEDKFEGQEEAVLTDAPEVPPPITRKKPTKVIVRLETKEVVKRLADGVDYTFWTFGGRAACGAGGTWIVYKLENI